MHLKLAPSPVLQSICMCTYLHHKQSKSVRNIDFVFDDLTNQSKLGFLVLPVSLTCN